MTLLVQTPESWHEVSALGGPVVDPMIIRCGELFLRGSAGAANQGAAWDLLDKNMHALSTFFDHLVLEERIPVFNYADSWDADQNFAHRMFEQVNQEEEVLVDVRVGWQPYTEVKTCAMEELKKLYSAGSAGVPVRQAMDILGELTASGYAWYPQLDGLVLADENEQRLAAFILGGLIFGAYAQITGADHLMQPKRSRLFLALSLKQDASRNAEDFLFSKLAELSGRPTTEIPYTPTFFPMLLSTSDGPGELFKKAMKLRKSGEVKDYRAWLHETLLDFKRNGRIAVERYREVDKIADAIRSRMAGIPFPKVEIKTTVADVTGGKLPGVGLDLTAPAKAVWGWVIERLPSKRHRKLLTRAIIADREYLDLGIRIATVWGGQGLPE